jgi:hypothetical protein
MGYSYLEILEVIDYYCDRRNFNLSNLQVVDKLNICTDYFAILRNFILLGKLEGVEVIAED